MFSSFLREVKADADLERVAKPNRQGSRPQLQSNIKQYNWSWYLLSSFEPVSSAILEKTTSDFHIYAAMRLPKACTSTSSCLLQARTPSSTQRSSLPPSHLKAASGSRTRKCDSVSLSRVPRLMHASEQSRVVSSRRQQQPINPINQRNFHTRTSHPAFVSVTCPLSICLPSLLRSSKPWSSKPSSFASADL